MPAPFTVAAVRFCAPQQARHTVINGKSVVRDGEIVTMDMKPVITTHKRCAAKLLEAEPPAPVDHATSGLTVSD